MKILIQRSKNSSVKVENKVVGKINYGMVIFICFESLDGEELIHKAISRLLKLRIFDDPQTKKMSYTIEQVKGQVLVISQFTLSWNGQGGNRPSFDASMSPLKAQNFFQKFCEDWKETSTVPIESGIFGADMEVQIINDGPVTFFLQV
jgi:D-tyrosyl-tRNA(Tyr) deacylase